MSLKMEKSKEFFLKVPDPVSLFRPLLHENADQQHHDSDNEQYQVADVVALDPYKDQAQYREYHATQRKPKLPVPHPSTSPLLAGRSLFIGHQITSISSVSPPAGTSPWLSRTEGRQPAPGCHR